MSAATTEPADITPVASRGLGRQLIVNTIATGLYNLFYLVIGLWYTPYLVNTLGIEMQAVAPLAGQFIIFIQFASIGIGGSIGRFVLADYARGDIEGANRTFNTFLVAARRASYVLVAAIAGIVWFVVPRLNYPAGYLNTTRFVFAAILLGAVMQIWSMCFDASTWISGRMDVRQGIQMLELFVRNGFVLLLFTVIQPKLLYVGVAFLLAPLSTLMMTFLAFRKFAPELKVDLSLYDPGRFREIRNVGGWSLLIQVGCMMMFNTDMIILNKTLGARVQGSYGLVLMWGNIFRSLFMGLSSLTSPSIVAHQANEDHLALSELVVKAVRTQGLLLAIPMGVLCGLAAPVLNWWLRAQGPEFVFLAPLAWLILVPMALEAAYLPAMIVAQLPSAISVLAKVTVILGVVNVVLGISLVKFTGMGMYGVAVATAITAILRHAVILPIYSAKLMHRAWYVLIYQQARTIIQFAVTALIAFAFSPYVAPKSFLQLVEAATVAGALGLGFALLQLGKGERMRLLSGLLRR